MTRLRFLAGLVGMMAKAQMANKQPFYITGLGDRRHQNDCDILPIIAYGESRSDALRSMLKHATVWTESEWKAATTFTEDYCNSLPPKPKVP
jgi:hypothetical protein